MTLMHLRILLQLNLARNLRWSEQTIPQIFLNHVHQDYDWNDSTVKSRGIFDFRILQIQKLAKYEPLMTVAVKNLITLPTPRFNKFDLMFNGSNSLSLIQNKKMK